MSSTRSDFPRAADSGADARGDSPRSADGGADARRPRPFFVRAFVALASGVFYWMPVWIPLGLLAQVALLGLKPARAESRRLAVHERVLRARLEERIERRDELAALHAALSDPVYRERLRLERSGRR